MLYKHILVPVDGSPTSLAAIQHAVQLAKIHGSQVSLIFVMVVDTFIGVDYVSVDQQKDDMNNHNQPLHSILANAQQHFLAQDIQATTQIIEGTDVSKEIAKAAQNLNVDLIVMGSHGHTGFKKFLLGSVAKQVLGEVRVPVLVIHD